MHSKVLGLITSLVAASGFLSAAPVLRWDFKDRSEVAGFENVQLWDVQNGELLASVKFDPFFSLKLPAASLQASDYDTLSLRLHSSKSADNLSICYSAPNGDWCLADTGRKVEEGWAEYEIDLSKVNWRAGEGKDEESKKWGGREDKFSVLRIDPGNLEGRDIKVDWVKLEKKDAAARSAPGDDDHWGLHGKALSGWACNALELKVLDYGGLSGGMKDGSFIESPKLAWDASKIKAVEVGWMAQEEAGFLRLRWTCTGADGNHGSGAVAAGFFPDGAQTLLYNLSAQENWRGTITSLRFEVNSNIRRPDLMTLGYVIGLPEENVVGNASLVMKIPGKDGEIFGGWREVGGQWTRDVGMIIPRSEYVFGNRKSELECRLEVCDIDDKVILRQIVNAAKPNSEFAMPALACSARISILTGTPSRDSYPLLSVSKPAKAVLPSPYWRGSWIWPNTGFGPVGFVWFHKELKLPAPPAAADMLIAADDAFELYINGTLVDKGEDWNRCFRIPIAKHLRQGSNDVLVKVDNRGAWGGLIAEICLHATPEQESWIVTDDSWRYLVSQADHPPEVAAIAKPAIIIGAPPVSPWGDNLGYTDISKPAQENKVTGAQGETRLAEARIVNAGKLASISINGKSYPASYTAGSGGFFHFPETAATTFTDFSKFNVNIHRFSLEMRKIWTAAETYDFSALDAAMRAAVASDPQGYFLLTVVLEAPEWWLQGNPDEMLKYYGEPRRPQSDFQAMSSEKWLAAADAFLRKIIRHARQQPYGSRIIGLGPCAGQTWEWILESGGYGHDKVLYADYSVAATRAYHKWLAAKYGGKVEALRSSWGNPTITFDTVDIPTPDERKGAQTEFLDPAQARPLIDYRMHINENVADNIIALCRAIKEESGQKWLAGTYYGYSIMFSRNYKQLQESGHLELARVLDSPHVDYIVCPGNYSIRIPGASNAFMMPAEPAALRGKIVILENDQRNFTEPLDVQWECGKAENPELTYGMISRDAGLTLAHGMGQHWFDMRRTWFREPVILQAVARQMDIYRKLGNKVSQNAATEVCVVMDNLSPYYMKLNVGENINEWLVDEPLRRLPEAGFPFHVMLLEDVLKDKFVGKYKLYVMLNTCVMTARQRERFNARLEAESASVVWLYAPGAMTPTEGVSAANASATCGIGLKIIGAPRSLDLVADESFSHESARCSATLSPWFVIDDKSVAIHGKSSDGLPVLGCKEFPARKTWFASVPNLSPGIFVKIAQMAGVWIYSSHGDPVHIGNDMVFLHAKRHGEKCIELPFKGCLRPISGPLKTTLASGEKWPAKAGMTYGFAIEKL